MALVTQCGPDSRQGFFTASLCAYRPRIRAPLKTWGYGVIWGPRLANGPQWATEEGNNVRVSQIPASGGGIPPAWTKAHLTNHPSWQIWTLFGFGCFCLSGSFLFGLCLSLAISLSLSLYLSTYFVPPRPICATLSLSFLYVVLSISLPLFFIVLSFLFARLMVLLSSPPLQLWEKGFLHFWNWPSSGKGKRSGPGLWCVSRDSSTQIWWRSFLLGTGVSSTSGFDLHLVELSTNVNSTWNQQKTVSCHWI